MDAFSALSANLAQTAPSAPANTAGSSSSNKPFASHLQSATKQHRAGQRSETSASSAQPQTDAAQAAQTTAANADQSLVPQNTQAKHEAAEPENSTAAAEATATAGAMNAAPASQPAQPVHGEAVAATSSSVAAAAATAANANTTAMSRLLDAITATTPASTATAPQPTQSTPISSSAQQTTAAPVIDAQQIVIENAAPATASSPDTPPATTTPEISASMPAALPSAAASTQLPGQTAAGQASLPTSSPTIVVQSATDAQNASTNAVTSLPQSDVAPDAPLVVQNQYGQIITIAQNSTMLATTDDQTTTVTPFAGNADADMDLTNQYIHSHLPNETATKGEENNPRSAMNSESEQSMPQNQAPQQVESPSAAEPMVAAKTLPTTGQESQPLIFSHQQGSGLSSAPLSTSTTTTAESSLYRLPTGTTVPETAVIDQMISHFSINKRLESGTVSLRLHPQELGELRMEIKVEQDNVKAHIVAQSPHAQEMIDRHLPKLREALEQQGLHLSEVEVTVATNDNAAGQAFGESTTWQQSQHSMASKQSQAVFSLENLDEELDTTAELDTNLSVIA